MFEPVGRMDKHSCNDLEYVQGEGGFRLMLPVQALHQLKNYLINQGLYSVNRLSAHCWNKITSQNKLL